MIAFGSDAGMMIRSLRVLLDWFKQRQFGPSSY
jgi:hypothetical protein